MGISPSISSFLGPRLVLLLLYILLLHQQSFLLVLAPAAALLRFEWLEEGELLYSQF